MEVNRVLFSFLPLIPSEGGGRDDDNDDGNEDIIVGCLKKRRC